MTPSAELAEQHLIEADRRRANGALQHGTVDALVGIGYALLAVVDAIREVKP